MPKIKLRSTAHVLSLPAPAEGRATYFDHARGAPQGFAVRVTATGARAYYLTYHFRGKYVWFKVGDSTDSLTKARAEAEKRLAQVKAARRGEGPDPVTTRAAERQAKPEPVLPTFEAVCLEYVKDRERDISPVTATEYRRQVKAYISKHKIGRTRAVDVTALDLKARLNEMPAKAMANRLHALMKAVCGWAAKLGTMPSNPMAVVDKPAKEASRERVLGDDELACLWAATESERPTVRAAVRLLVLLGQRVGETLEGLRWDGLDLDSDIKVWTIPGRFRKGGRLHTVPLPESVVRMIEDLRPITGTTERVLDVVEPNSEVMWWGRVRDRAHDIAREREVRTEHFTKHDLRRTATTGMRRLGVSPHVAELVIGHVVGSEVARTYDRYAALPERASALAAWAAHVERVARGEKRGADILAHKARA